MRRSSLLLALVASLVLAVPATAAPPTRLLAFGTGEVTIEGDTARLVNDPTGEYSGVYLSSRSQSGKPLNAVSFSFSYSGTVAGGAPRFSIPIDTDRDGSVDGYAFLDAINCGLTGTVSTESPNCLVYFGSDVYANWDAFANAPGNEDYRIAPGSIPFIIADQAGTYIISNIDLR